MSSNHSLRRESASREAAAMGKRDAGKSTKKAGMLFLHFAYCSVFVVSSVLFLYSYFIYSDKGKTAKEEARELMLREEASIRENVQKIQRNLSLLLRVLGEMAIANPVFAHSQLPSLVCQLVFSPSFRWQYCFQVCCYQ